MPDVRSKVLRVLVCCLHHHGIGRSIMGRKKTNPIERFWSKVDQSGGPNSCWPWMAGVDRYGRFCDENGKTIGAHTYAFFLANGYFAEVSRHSCDNTICCNPSHVIDGSHIDNVRDRVERGRGAIGSKQAGAILNEQQVSVIKTLIRIGCTNREIASRYGVCESTVSHIKTGRQWSFVVEVV